MANPEHLTASQLTKLPPSYWPIWYLRQEYHRQERETMTARNRHTRFVILNGVLVTTLVVACFVTTTLWLQGVCK